MAKTLSISEVRAKLSELVAGVERHGQEIVVTRNSKPVATLVSHAKDKGMKATLDVLSDPELMRQIRASEEFYAKGGKGLSFEEVFGEPLRPVKKRTRRNR